MIQLFFLLLIAATLGALCAFVMALLLGMMLLGYTGPLAAIQELYKGWQHHRRTMRTLRRIEKGKEKTVPFKEFLKDLEDISNTMVSAEALADLHSKCGPPGQAATSPVAEPKGPSISSVIPGDPPILSAEEAAAVLRGAKPADVASAPAATGEYKVPGNADHPAIPDSSHDVLPAGWKQNYTKGGGGIKHLLGHTLDMAPEISRAQALEELKKSGIIKEPPPAQLLQVTLKYDRGAKVIELKEAQKWDKHITALCNFGAAHGFTPFDSYPIQWRDIPEGQTQEDISDAWEAKARQLQGKLDRALPLLSDLYTKKAICIPGYREKVYQFLMWVGIITPPDLSKLKSRVITKDGPKPPAGEGGSL